MTALRAYDRDLGLPERLGDGGLALPGPEALHALVVERLLAEPCVIESVALSHARWKPGVALVGLYTLTLSGGEQRWVGCKRHVAGKGARLAEEYALAAPAEPRAEALAAPLRAGAPLPEGDGYLWTFPADRVLRGAQRALDPARLARRFDDQGLGGAGFVLRRRASRLQVLRYKPERRVVARLEAKLRGQDGARARRTVGLRLLPPADAARVAALRSDLERRYGGAAPLPRLLAFDERDGLLYEEWLDGEGRAPDDFGHARAAGSALAALHRLTPGTEAPAPRALRVERADSARFLAGIPELSGAAASWLAAPAGVGALAPRVVVHGDLHPDQLLCTPDGPRLLDLDTLRGGAPEEDLASWIADHLAEAPDLGYTDAAAGLVRGYVAAGGAFDGEVLAQVVAAELAQRACAALRRLERGAVAKAQRLVARALRVAEGGDAA